jgi:DNA-binding NtrC family response regulator
MSYILVVSDDSSCRRLYVDNLVRRGYVAAGVASAREAGTLIQETPPNLVVVCCNPDTYEQDIEQLRTIYDSALPVVLFTEDRPDPAWAASRNVVVRFTDTVDPRRLVEILRPLLPGGHAA